MQDINNKLADLLEKLTDFFEHFSDESASYKQYMADSNAKEDTVISHLKNIENKQDTIIDLLRTIAAK